MGASTGPEDAGDRTPDPDDIEARFAEITASLDDLTVPPGEPAEDPSGAAASGAPTGRSPGPRDYTVAEDDEHFVPPDPEPLTPRDPVVGLAWAGVLTPLTLLFVYLMAWRGMPSGLLAVAGVVFLASVAVLVWRMPTRRDTDDDGAVV